MWMFMPRKLSRQSYDEVIDAGKCVNLMAASPDPVAEDGSGVILQKYLGFLEQRGASDFLLVPGTKDCHVFVIRTEESLDGVISTFSSVIDLEGNTLMAEKPIGEDRKFEGAAWVNGWGAFDGAAQPASSGECVIA